MCEKTIVTYFMRSHICEILTLYSVTYNISYYMPRGPRSPEFRVTMIGYLRRVVKSEHNMNKMDGGAELVSVVPFLRYHLIRSGF